jgi:3'(2'), 5'-bisphosphate nucleotidase
MGDAWEREIEVARGLAVEAGKLILGYRGLVDAEMKADESPVTRADREASELILAGLGRAFPDDVLISEEAEDDPRRLEPGRRVWFIDPLDGTRDFVAGRPGFAVMIGLNVDGRPVAGVVYQPLGEKLFWAARGRGAHMEDDGGTRRLRVTAEGEVQKMRLVASASHRDGQIDRVNSALGISDEVQIGSVGLKLALISLAERDLYVNPSSKSKTWDTSAPEIILVEAGGKLTDLHGRPLPYDQPDMWHQDGLVASNGAAHERVIERLRELFPRKPR